VFGKDGSLTVTSNVTQPNVHTGKYRIEGDVVHSMLNSTSEYGKHSQFTVTKLTDDTLEVVGTADDDYTTGVFKRVK
jgi:hypothetical protein